MDEERLAREIVRQQQLAGALKGPPYYAGSAYPPTRAERSASRRKELMSDEGLKGGLWCLAFVAGMLLLAGLLWIALSIIEPSNRGAAVLPLVPAIFAFYAGVFRLSWWGLKYLAWRVCKP